MPRGIHDDVNISECCFALGEKFFHLFRLRDVGGYGYSFAATFGHCFNHFVRFCRAACAMRDDRKPSAASRFAISPPMPPEAPVMIAAFAMLCPHFSFPLDCLSDERPTKKDNVHNWHSDYTS